MTKIKFALLLCFVVFTNTYAQVGIGTKNPETSSILDVKSETKGFLPPRVALAEDLVDPAEGLVVYDLTDDCINVFDGNNWINLCEAASGSSGSGSAGIGANGLFPWQNTTPMFQMWGAECDACTSTGVTPDGNAYVWGYDKYGIVNMMKNSNDTSATNNTSASNSTSEYYTAPYQISDPELDGKTKKIVGIHNAFVALNTDNELWGFGRNHGGWLRASSGSNLIMTKLRQIALPSTMSGTDYVIDFYMTYERLVILTNEGKVFWYSSGAAANNLGPVSSSTNWNQLAQPSGAAADFKYTRILNVNTEEGGVSHIEYRRALYLYGEDSNGSGIYGCGKEVNSSSFTFGNSSLNSNGVDPRTSAGIHPIAFPTGVAATVSHIQVAGDGVNAITTDGKWYYWGKLGSSETLGNAMKGLWTESNADGPFGGHYAQLAPKEMPLPPGESSVKDVFMYNGTGKGLAIVGSSGKIYFYGTSSQHGDIDVYLMAPYPEGFGASHAFVEAYSTSHVNAKRIILGQYSMMILDEDGQVWGFGLLDNTEGMVVQQALGASGTADQYAKHHSMAAPLWGQDTDNR